MNKNNIQDSSKSKGYSPLHFFCDLIAIKPEIGYCSNIKPRDAFKTNRT
ncbi:hypothetical protein GQ41_1518 [Arenibacter algicola]|uniref:Transposase n=1 Tax=Arenibacter algicola TaxID=616991 RepID=A0ABY3A991_9FLAO